MLVKLRKELEKKLLEGIFAEYSLINSGQSNNGAFYTLKKGDDIRHIKIVDKEQEEEEGLNERLVTEVASGSRYVAKLLGTGNLNERYAYLEFQFIPGKDLTKLGQLDATELEKLARNITMAINDIWSRGVVHRDIKPANIMRGDDGNYYLVDLGIGYFMETPSRDNTKTKGSRYYSSPEQFFASTDNRVEVSFSSDLYSLGMVLFEKATGVHPKSSWSSKHNGYGELITQTEPPKIEAFAPHLPKKLVIFINKLLAVYKSDRFLTPQHAMEVLKGTKPAKEQMGEIFVHDTNGNYAYIDKYLTGKDTVKPDGVVVSVLQGEERVKALNKMGYEKMIIDPVTYKLPHSLASNSSLKRKLGYKAKAPFNSIRVNQARHEIIRKTLELQNKATIYLLPYFAIESLDDPFLETSKIIWTEGRAVAEELDVFKPVYGGLVIPASITKETRATDKLINIIHSKYDVDGFYLIFESVDDKITAIDSPTFLSNVKKIVNTFSSMGKVIVAHADVSYLLTCREHGLVFGWSNSKRRFIFDNVLNGKASGFMSKDYDPKLPYYIPQLLTIVKGEEELESLNTFAPTGSLACSCESCEELSPYDGVTPKRLELGAHHYFRAIVNQHESLKVDPYTTSADILSGAMELTRAIKKSSGNTVGGKLIPSHEAILGVINN